MEGIYLKTIARIESDFPEKFGIPRQSGLVDSLEARIVFEPPFRRPEAVRGLEAFSHLWLLWYFSETARADWSPTVRPPRLGGNRRMGVFATRSPYRPNAVGLSAVRLLRVEMLETLGPVLTVAGADLMNGTPLIDIKPYLPFADAYPDAACGFAEAVKEDELSVEFPEALLCLVPETKRAALLGILAGDPRPSYQNDPARVYGFGFAGLEIHFTVSDSVLTVCRVERAAE